MIACNSVSIVSFEEVGAEAEGALDGLVVAPLGDFGFVAREEDIGHAPPFVFRRTGVDGGREEVVLKGVAERALLVADGPGDEAHYGVGDDDGGELAPGEHVVAD